jgi:hypothetical protein
MNATPDRLDQAPALAPGRAHGREWGTIEGSRHGPGEGMLTPFLGVLTLFPESVRDGILSPLMPCYCPVPEGKRLAHVPCAISERRRDRS